MERTRTKITQRKLTETERICPVCNKKFFGFGRARFCSVACRNAADYEKHREARQATRRDRYHAAKK